MTDIDVSKYHPIDKPDPKTGRLGPRELVVRPDGIISSIVVGLAPERGDAKGSIVNQVVGPRGRVSVAIAPFYRDQGWVFLRDAYAEDPNHERKTRGFEVYETWNNAGRRGKVEKLDDAWLPKLVRDRREAAAKARRHGVVKLPPAPADDATENAAVGGEGKAKKGRRG